MNASLTPPLRRPRTYKRYDVATLFTTPLSGVEDHCLRALDAKRWTGRDASGLLRRLDFFPDQVTACCFARWSPAGALNVSVALLGEYSIVACDSGGWLFLPREEGLLCYWMPQPPRLRRLDVSGHVIDERSAGIEGIAISAHDLELQVHIPKDWVVDLVVWRISQTSENCIDELRDLLVTERQAYFLWGSHTVYRRPSDVYLHVLHGHVYEFRYNWPKYWKICSENDAHALYTVLSGLKAATGKQLYHLLKLQLLLSVLDRQGEDGGWRHGEWTDHMESHYRLHCSAMHMLMDALVERDDSALRAALERAAAFLAQRHDKLNIGIWFFHDELEHSTETMKKGPFPWIPSRALSKSESNMLVLNSHLDATVALDRYSEVTGDKRYSDLVARAASATQAVLSLRSAEWMYRIIFRTIRLTFLPTAHARQLPAALRALKRIAWKYLIPILPRLKAHWPRIVMPGGYIERELSLPFFAHDYLPINLMDLFRYRRRFPKESGLDEIIVGAIDLIQDCRMTERWPEIKGKEYAVGFWAEALYHACLAFPDPRYRAMLAEAVIALQKQNVGLPPSLLGANAEAVAPKDQSPTPVPCDERVRVVNLCRKGVAEILLVNCVAESVPLRFAVHPPEGLVWTAGRSTESADHSPQEIAPNEWVWGHDRSAAAAAI